MHDVKPAPQHRSIEPVRVTAYSCVSACGEGSQALADHLMHNRSALGRLTLLDLPFDTPVGECRGTLPAVRPDLIAYQCRNARLALAALNNEQDGLRGAVEAARQRFGPARIGVIIGTSTSGLLETEAAYQMLLKEGKMPADFHFLTRHAYQATARFLQNELGLAGPCYAISTACSSSAKALAAGQRLIHNGVCDAVLAGGADSLCRLTLRGFNALELISDQRCKPMDRNRNGINIGEAAALLLLERDGSTEPFRRERNGTDSGCPKGRRQGWRRSNPLLLAGGESSDAHHMSHPHPQGKGAQEAMEMALRQCGLTPESIDYINMHATATRLNDAVEAKAMEALFGDSVPCSATKGITGHTLGAAGALEAIISLLALKGQWIPGTCGLEAPDPAFGCRIAAQPQNDQRLNTVMSNVFGFGGNNISLIFSLGDG
jgi:3-oxoacyl-[acyl-carrier-protein] synthase I